MAHSVFERLAVCSWSLQPENPAQLLAHLEAIGIRRVQLALDPLRAAPGVWADLPRWCREHGITLVSGMFGTVGEDYTTPATIRRTGGVTPDETWPENWRNIQTVAGIARDLGLKLVTFHAGFLPHDPTDPQYVKLLGRIGTIADHFAGLGLDLAFETGQETAAALAEFLGRLNRRNVGVNFDPANMILYQMGDPIAALQRLGPWLKQCHIKDATSSRVAGEWGSEVVAGTGEVAWPAFFATLKQTGFTGNLAIEREAGTQRREDILAARRFLEQLPTA